MFDPPFAAYIHFQILYVIQKNVYFIETEELNLCRDLHFSQTFKC